MVELPAAAVLSTIIAGVVVAWVLRRLRPGMPLMRRTLHIAGWGLVLGGALYSLAMIR